MRRALWIALLALLVLPASSRAFTVPAPDALMARAHALGVARWNLEPCNGAVAISWAHLPAGVNARSAWLAEPGAGPETYQACSVTFSYDVWWDWPKLCTVVEHELGHLAGHEHTATDSLDVMSPHYYFPSPECDTSAPTIAAPIKGAGPVLARSTRRPSLTRIRRVMALCRIRIG